MIDTSTLRRPYPIAFFAVAFAWAWAFWAVPLAATRGWISVSSSNPLLFLMLVVGAFGPFVGALVFNLRSGTALAFFGRALLWRMPPLALSVALLISPLLGGLAVWSYSAHGGVPFDIQIGWKDAGLLIVILFFLGGSCNEEFGWAYAIDQIQTRVGSLRGSLLVGLIWACWHLPLFFIPTQSQSHMPFVAFVLTCCSLRVMMVWAYNRSRQSIFVTLLFHTSMNLTTNLFVILNQNDPPSHQPAWWFYTGFLSLAATICALAQRRRHARFRPLNSQTKCADVQVPT